MYIITTSLIIRQFCLSDFSDFLSLIQDKMASEMSVYDEQFPTNEESVRDIFHFFSQSSEFMAIELMPEKRVIGFVSLNVISENVDNLGFCIHSCYQHKGYASEAIMGVIEYAKTQLSVKKLVSGTAEQNEAAVKLLQDMGFSLVSKEQTSFTKDKNGSPIFFTGLSFELLL